MGFTLRRDDTGVPVAGYDEFNDASRVITMQKKWRAEFPGSSLDTTKWEVKQTGSGMSIAVASDRLQINAGTTANSETIIDSVETFTVPFRVSIGWYLSQYIANQEFRIEVISVDKATLQPDGKNRAAYVISYDFSTSNVYYRVETANEGRGGVQSGNVYGGIACTSAHIAEIEVFPDETWFHQRNFNSGSGRTSSISIHQQSPDPNALYKVRIRVTNKSTAPTSATILHIYHVVVNDYTELTAEITAGRGAISSGQAMSVYDVASTKYVYNRVIWYTDTTTNLASGVTYTGSTRDTGLTGQYKFLRYMIYSDQNGRLDIECSRDGSIWRLQQQINITANTCNVGEVQIYTRYVRIKYTNTGTATTTILEVNTALFAF